MFREHIALFSVLHLTCNKSQILHSEKSIRVVVTNVSDISHSNKTRKWFMVFESHSTKCQSTNMKSRRIQSLEDVLKVKQIHCSSALNSLRFFYHVDVDRQHEKVELLLFLHPQLQPKGHTEELWQTIPNPWLTGRILFANFILWRKMVWQCSSSAVKTKNSRKWIQTWNVVRKGKAKWERLWRLRLESPVHV